MEITEIAAGLGVGGGQLFGGTSGSENPFLTLVVTELQNQNPLEPVSNTDFLAQLAQFSTLEQMESLNANLASQAAFAQFGQAANLVGKEVAYLDPSGETLRGRIDSVLIQGAQVFAEISGQAVPLGSIVQVFAGDGSPPPAPDTESPPELPTDTSDVDTDDRR